MKLEINRPNLQFCFNDEVWRLQSRGSQDRVFVGKTVLCQQLQNKVRICVIRSRLHCAQRLFLTAGKQWKSVSVLRKQGV